MAIRIKAKATNEELLKFRDAKDGERIDISLYPYRNNYDTIRVDFNGIINSGNQGDDFAIRMIDSEIRDVIREHMLCYTPKDVIEILEYVKQQIKDNNGNKD